MMLNRLIKCSPFYSRKTMAMSIKASSYMGMVRTMWMIRSTPMTTNRTNKTNTAIRRISLCIRSRVPIPFSKQDSQKMTSQRRNSSECFNSWIRQVLWNSKQNKVVKSCGRRDYKRITKAFSLVPRNLLLPCHPTRSINLRKIRMKKVGKLIQMWNRMVT